MQFGADPKLNPCTVSVSVYFTQIIFAQFSPTRVGFYCQRIPHKKYLAAYETQRFQLFVRNPLEKLSPRAGRKLSENDQLWGIGGLISPHDLRVHNHNDILVLKRFYFKLNKKISLSPCPNAPFLSAKHNNILPPKFPKFPAT